MSEATIEVKNLAVVDLVPYENNPRINTDAVDGLARSISRYGFLVPVVVDANMVIVTGHTRLLAAKQLGMTHVPVIQAMDLTEAEAAGFRLADNRLSENSRWDEGKLASELDMLYAMGFDIGETGFSKEELDCLTNPITADCLDDLSASNVCGDIEPVVMGTRKFVIVSVGTYRVPISIPAYNDWDRELLKQYGSRSEVQKALLVRLGMTEAIGKFPL